MNASRGVIKYLNFAQAYNMSTQDMAKMLGMDESKVLELREDFQKTSSLHYVRDMVAVNNQQ